MAGPAIGDVVKYVDHSGVEHNAMVTANWTRMGNFVDETVLTPSLNIVYVELDEAKHDQYGNQIGRDTSVVHKSNQFAPGNYWY